MKKKIKGRVWKFGSNVDTDQIIPAEYLVTGDPKELARHAFEKVRSEFARDVREGDIIVADENFGCGSSREHAPRALIGAGISCVVAKSFARIFYRNCINLGLPIFTSPEAADALKTGDLVEIDADKGQIRNEKSKKVYSSETFPDFITYMIKSVGLMAYPRSQQ